MDLYFNNALMYSRYNRRIGDGGREGRREEEKKRRRREGEKEAK